MDIQEHKPTLLFLIFLIISLFLIGDLSNFGFLLTEYIAEQRMFNYVSAFLLALIGFFNSYRYYKIDNVMTAVSAIKIYLYFGLGMSGIYYLVYVTHVGCYSLPEDISTSPSIIDFIYFSFVTITTVGYGDIVPRHTFVRFLVLFQVLFAVFLFIRASKPPK